MQQKITTFIYYLGTMVLIILSAGGIVKADAGLILQGKVKDSCTILLQWESEHTDNVYQLQKSIEGQSYSTLATISGQEGNIQCYDYDVEMGKTYNYKLVQLLDYEVIQESPEITVRMTLATPEGLKAKTTKDNRISLTWGKVDRATSYTIYRSKKPKKGFKKLTAVKKNSYIDCKVEKGNTYYYKIVANYKNKKSFTSGKSETTKGYVKAAAPQVVGIYVKEKIKLTWKKVQGADRYYIYKKNAKGKYKRIGKTSKLYYRDGNIQADCAYTYKVIAVSKVDGKMKKGMPSSPCTIKATMFDPNQKMVALTFDDGPSRYTKDILRCLKENQSRATFFVLGCNIGGYEAVLAEADKIGCEIANHSYSHPNLTKLLPSGVATELNKTDDKVEAVTGKIPSLVRPPGGVYDKMVETNVKKPIILWSIDTRDWEHRDRDKTIRIVLDEVQDGDIILMHDIYEPSKDAACALITALRREGYQLVTVSELAVYRGYTLEEGKGYRNFRKIKQ